MTTMTLMTMTTTSIHTKVITEKKLATRKMPTTMMIYQTIKRLKTQRKMSQPLQRYLSTQSFIT